MKTRRFAALTATVAIGLLAAAPARAQQQGHGQMDHGARRAGDMMQGCPMGQIGPVGMKHGHMGGGGAGAMVAAMAFGPGPAMLLHQKEALDLTEEQASRLDSLRAAMHATLEEHRTGMQGVHEQMRGLAATEGPGLDRFRQLLRRMADARVELAVEVARTHRQAMGVLTEEQRSNARYGMKLMHHRMMRRGHGEPRHHERPRHHGGGGR